MDPVVRPGMGIAPPRAIGVQVGVATHQQRTPHGYHSPSIKMEKLTSTFLDLCERFSWIISHASHRSLYADSMNPGSMYLPHQIAKAAIETAAEKVWTQVDHNRADRRGCFISAQPLLSSADAARTVLVMYFDKRVIARQASQVVLTTLRSISLRTIEPDWSDLIRARRRRNEGLNRNTAYQQLTRRMSTPGHTGSFVVAHGAHREVNLRHVDSHWISRGLRHESTRQDRAMQMRDRCRSVR